MNNCPSVQAWIPPSLHEAIAAGACTEDLTVYIQTALNEVKP
jgi:hypothetical protein